VRRTLAALGVLVAAAIGGATAAPAAAPPGEDPQDSHAPFDLRSARLDEHEGTFSLELKTWADWPTADLGNLDQRRLCVLTYGRGEPHPRAQVCAVAEPGSALPALRAIRYYRPTPGGGLPVPATVSRPDGHTVRARFPAYIVGPSGPFEWSAASTTAFGPDCSQPVVDPDICTDAFPDFTRIEGTASSRISRCSATGPSFRLYGPRGRRVVALTFDDGPSSYTPAILAILRAERVPATFFLIGNQVRARADLVRRELAEGHMIGNHTWNHAVVAGGGLFARGELTRTQDVIHEVAGFTPCLFRPPYGAVSHALAAVARSLGALTINWDVDPQDWHTPGTGAIEARVLRAVQPGSIVLMHDGGGYRGQTVAALRPIIRTLRKRGYKFATVDELLGLKVTPD
jgi:peptidoglycan/xylan/chitin deacetylase (PgdA/CDA1 family)